MKRIVLIAAVVAVAVARDGDKNGVLSDEGSLEVTAVSDLGEECLRYASHRRRPALHPHPSSCIAG